jgi:serine/threonine protein phosphatase PrpC
MTTKDDALHTKIENPSQSVVFSARDTVDAGEFYDLPQGQLAVFLRKRPGRETDNEDSVGIQLLVNGDSVFTVADGMGGAQGGARASEIVVQTLHSILSRSKKQDAGCREEILNAFETANQEILKLGIGAGSTVATVELSGNQIRPFHAGDSQILLVGQRGKQKLLTVSHSPVGYGVEAGLIDAVDAIDHKERHLISNHVGSSDMRIEIGSAVSMARRDTLLIASDGLFDNVHVAELLQLIRKGSLKKVCANLVTLLTSRMAADDKAEPSKPDDVGFILYRRSL